MKHAILVAGELDDTLAILRCPYCDNTGREADSFTYLGDEGGLLECGKCAAKLYPPEADNRTMARRNADDVIDDGAGDDYAKSVLRLADVLADSERKP